MEKEDEDNIIFDLKKTRLDNLVYLAYGGGARVLRMYVLESTRHTADLGPLRHVLARSRVGEHAGPAGLPGRR